MKIIIILIFLPCVAIIELLNKTVNTLTGGGVKDDQEQAVMPDYSDIWDIKPFKDDDFWFMKIGMPFEVGHVVQKLI